jgi:thioesterase domain-containing protein
VLLGADTIEQLAALLLQGESKDRLAYAVPVQSEGEKPILFCVGAGLLFRPLILHLGPDQPFFSVGIEPGAVERLGATYKVEDLARHMVSALREREPQGPYYLAGFCDDGVFAYEVASQLTAQGQSVRLLVLFETENRCPSTKARIVTGLRRIVIRLRFRVNQLLRLKIAEIPFYLRSRREEVKGLLTRSLWHISRDFQLSKRHSGPPDMERILFLAASAYKPKPLRCPTVIFRCKDWPIASAGDPYFGWSELLSGPCETREVPGDHMGMFRDPNAKVLADQLSGCLHKARQS